MNFRTQQSIVDLRRSVIAMLEVQPPEQDFGRHQLLARLTASLAERSPVWHLDLPPELIDEMQIHAASPENERVFLISTCGLLLDRFENPDRGTDFDWEWESFVDNYRAASPFVRAALMNAFEHARMLSLVSDVVRPAPEDRISLSKRVVIQPLIALAKSLTSEQRQSISTADYGAAADRHFAALNELLESTSCLYPKGESWFPAEVVELVAGGGTGSEFVGCTSILLINAIHDGDHVANASFRWASCRHSYAQLKPAHQNSIYQAYRYLYETDPGWDPFGDQFAPERLSLDSYIPLIRSL